MNLSPRVLSLRVAKTSCQPNLSLRVLHPFWSVAQCLLDEKMVSLAMMVRRRNDGMKGKLKNTVKSGEKWENIKLYFAFGEKTKGQSNLGSKDAKMTKNVRGGTG